MRLFVLSALALSFACMSLTVDARQTSQQVALPDSVVPVLSQSKVVSIPAPTQTLYLAIGLQPRFPAELRAFCDSVSNPYSPNYRQFMTPQQVGESFGASATDVNGVVSFLKSRNLKVTLVAPNRMAILVEATVEQAERAFGAQIKNFQGPDPAGETIRFMANTSPLMVPSNIAPTIVCIDGINSYAKPHPLTTLTPALARGLYNTAPSYSTGIQGQGRSIAFSNWDGYRVSNAALFISNFSLPVPSGGSTSNIHIVSVSGSNANTDGAGEGDLDLQMELSAAPLSNIYIYDSIGSLLPTLTREASDNIADIISESYGWRGISGSTGTSCHNQHLAMTAQGQTYLCASGDSGTSGLNPSTGFPYPDEEPEVLSVGGTIATVNTTTGARISEVAWSGSGGGWSTDTNPWNVLPSWQHGNGVPTTINKRLVPDIGMHSASSGNAFYIYYAGSLATISGTSCASPYCASSLATLQQRLAANNWPANARMGRMNDLIYAENGRSDIWFDITSGSGNGTLPNGSASNPVAGWDFTTGWGAPNFDTWYTVLSTKTITGTVTLQNYSASPAGVSVTVQFYQAGTSTLVDTRTTTLDGSGNFSVTTQAPVGNYDVYVKASHWLRRKSAGQALNTTGASGLTFSLINGDINGDNTISLADFSQIRSAFGSSSGSSNWNPNADLNGDGSVGLGDFGILRTNFGMSGD